MSRFLTLSGQVWGVCLLLLGGFLMWEIWTKGAAYALSLPNLFWFGGMALYAAGLSAFIAAGSWLSEWLEHKKSK